MSPFVGDFDPLDPHNAAPKKSSSARTLVLLVCLGFLIALGVAWFLYDHETNQGQLPMIQAQDGAHKILPDTPDTSAVPHQDKKIYERIQLDPLAASQEPPRLTPEVLKGQESASGQRIVTRENPVPVTEGLRVYAPPPPGLPGLEDDDDEDEESADHPEDAASSEEAANDSDDAAEEEDDSDEEAEPSPAPKSVPQKAAIKKTSTSPDVKTTARSKSTKQAQKSQSASVKSKYRLQIASSTARANAEAEWIRLSHLYPRLKDMSHQVVAVDLGKTKGMRYRIYVGGWNAYADAQKMCATLKKQGMQAIVMQP